MSSIEDRFTMQKHKIYDLEEAIWDLKRRVRELELKVNGIELMIERLSEEREER
jgi:hypothetical protein